MRDTGRVGAAVYHKSHCLVALSASKVKHILKMADLLRAVRSGDIELVKKQCARPGTLVNSPLQGGRCALHVACETGKLDIIKFLVSKGADVNLEDNIGCVPLYNAIAKNQVNVVEYLIEMGADKKAESPEGESLEECTENEAILKLLQ